MVKCSAVKIIRLVLNTGVLLAQFGRMLSSWTVVDTLVVVVLAIAWADALQNCLCDNDYSLLLYPTYIVVHTLIAIWAVFLLSHHDSLPLANNTNSLRDGGTTTDNAIIPLGMFTTTNATFVNNKNNTFTADTAIAIAIIASLSVQLFCSLLIPVVCMLDLMLGGKQRWDQFHDVTMNFFNALKFLKTIPVNWAPIVFAMAIGGVVLYALFALGGVPIVIMVTVVIGTFVFSVCVGYVFVVKAAY